jgi:glycosyltransferase involved in cell wall biosynthesis
METASEPSMLRVLHLNHGKVFGGVETILVTLARFRQLCPSMKPSFLLCEEGRLSRELAAADVPVHLVGSVRISRPWTVWRARRELRRVLQRERFEIVVCHMPWSLVVFGPVVRSEGQRLGFWAHAFHAGQNWLERLARRIPPDLAIANSRFTLGGLANLFSTRTLTGVVYPPVELLETEISRDERTRTRAEQGADAETVVIIQVSRIEAGKGHIAHLEALAQLGPLDQKWVCWFVGGAQKPEEQILFDSLKAKAHELGISSRVRFLGQRSDINALLNAADIFCQPNQTPDSFGIAFVEALWAGVPVVTTSMGGAIEIIDDSCGLLLPPGNITLLAEALRRLIESPSLRSVLGRAGMARAMQLCDPGTQINRLRDLTRQIVK